MGRFDGAPGWKGAPSNERLGRLSSWREHRRWLISQIVLWGVGAAVLRLLIVPAEVCPRVEAPAVQRAIDEGAAWLVRGQGEDGRFLYGYYSERDQASRAYNTTRHAGVLDALYRAGRIRSADSGLAYVRESLVHEDDWSAFAPRGGLASVGTNGLLVLALLHRREATDEKRFDGLTRRMARFLVSQAQPDGSVLKYWRPATGRSVPGAYGRYSTGEAFYALALMHRTFPGEGWGRHAHRIVEYLATRRDEAEGAPMRQADHWAAYGLATLGPAELTEVEVDYARWLAGFFGYLIRFEAQHGEGSPSPVQQSGAALGTDGEAAAALWELAGSEPRLADLRDDLGDRVSCLAGTLVQRQVPPGNPNPSERGAWFSDGYTQMDAQQHVIAALLGAREAVR
jgi:hypothetical protein